MAVKFPLTRVGLFPRREYCKDSFAKVSLRNASPSKHAQPGQVVTLDSRNIRGLAHPLRVKMLGLLREHGPATASGLAARTGQSSGATSYHLRQLAAYGFIVEDNDLGTDRERWWRAAHRTTSMEVAAETDDESQIFAEEYLRGVANGYAERMYLWVDSLAHQPKSWADAGTISDWMLRLTPEQALALTEKLSAFVQQYADEHPTSPDVPPISGTERVFVQLQVLTAPTEKSDGER